MNTTVITHNKTIIFLLYFGYAIFEIIQDIIAAWFLDTWYKKSPPTTYPRIFLLGTFLAPVAMGCSSIMARSSCLQPGQWNLSMA